MNLYKYRNIGNLETMELDTNLEKLLSNGEFFLSNPKDFNDPFDCSFEYKIDGGKKELSKFFEIQGLSEKEIKTQFELHSIKELKEILIDRFSKEDLTRVYCLSSTYKSSLMWAHYAQEHYGVCIGFKTYFHENQYFLNISDSQYKAFKRKSPKNLVPLFNIDYRIDKLEPVDVVKNGPEGLFKHTTTKSIDWKYEEEKRLVFSSLSIERNPIHIKRSEILEIIFGLRTPSKIQQKVRNIVADQNHIRFYKMKMIKGSFQIEREDA